MTIVWCVIMPVISYCKAPGVENEDTEPLPLFKASVGCKENLILELMETISKPIW